LSVGLSLCRTSPSKGKKVLEGRVSQLEKSRRKSSRFMKIVGERPSFSRSWCEPWGGENGKHGRVLREKGVTRGTVKKKESTKNETMRTSEGRREDGHFHLNERGGALSKKGKASERNGQQLCGRESPGRKKLLATQGEISGPQNSQGIDYQQDFNGHQWIQKRGEIPQGEQ